MGFTNGSGKKTERTKLRSPKKDKGRAGGGGSGGGSGSEHEPAARQITCLASFEVELKQVAALKKGLALNLQDGEVLLFGAAVGKVSARQYGMVKACEQEGIKYRGVIGERARAGIKRYYGIFRSYR